MPRFKITNELGQITNIILAEEVYAASIGAVPVEEGDEIYSPPTLTPPAKTVFTKLEFMNKFTQAELETIYTAAKSVIAIEVWLDKFKLAQEIDITNTDTVGGIQALELSGILAEGRADEILS